MSASLTVGSDYFLFLSMESDNGFVLTQEMIVEEPLETPGVDGRRFRTIHKQHSYTEARSIQEATTFSDAVKKANQARKQKGKVGSLIVTAGGAATRIKVHVAEVSAVPRAGQPVGGGASASSAAHVVCGWTFVPIEFGPSESA